MLWRRSAILLCLSALAGVAAAQPSQERFERRLEQMRREEVRRVIIPEQRPLGGRALIDYGGYVSASYLSLDDEENRNHALRGYDLILYGKLELDRAHELFVRGRGSYLDFNSGDSFDDEGDRDEWVLERAHYRLDLRFGDSAPRAALEDGLTLQLGRQLVLWGNGLTLSEVLDGAVVTLRWDVLELEVLAGQTPEDDAIDFDTSRPEFDEMTRRAFFGGRVALNFPRHQPYAYVLAQHDRNDDEVAILGQPIDYDYDSVYLGIGSAGSLGDRLIYGAEFTWQLGESASDGLSAGNDSAIPQTREDINAWALDLRLDWLLAGNLNPRLSAELILASGDPDRRHTSNTLGGNRSGTDDHAFNAFGLLNTGLAFAPAVSNLIATRAGASVSPLARGRARPELQVGIDLFTFWKMRSSAPIDEETIADESFLGIEPDIFINYQVLEDVSIALRYGVFLPGDGFEERAARHFFFVGVSYAF